VVSAERVIRCTVGGESYAIRISDVRSLERADTMERGKDLTRVEGWFPRGDRRIPVFSLGAWLGSPPPSGPVEGKVLVVGCEESAWGVGIDGASRVLEVPAEDVLPLPAMVGPTAGARFDGVVRLGEELVLLVSSDALLAVPGPEGGRREGSMSDVGISRRLHRLDPGTGRSARKGRMVVFSAAQRSAKDEAVSFALSLWQVAEVLGAQPWIRVPLAPSWLRGMVGWRGKPLPVVDLLDRLGFGRGPERAERLLVARCSRLDGGEIAFPVMADVRNQRIPLVHGGDRRFPALEQLTKGVFAGERGMIVVPDLDRIALPG
jgi:chemotaxis signal transduction protein